ncbi:MAG: outer membrane lipoprotein-sorting protein [Candidatus Tectomicrobia bacterium]|uniref:Outer membrane lipoprotein-sorting protein n=1 Tax=Tectimicrobiota bacterium TaxID=2528274 RepID=A0A932CLY5_UNCTE|nr:outer membrane lipoprotein-sorting protein [Candidatus Tectomicrobia bacterium]
MMRINWIGSEIGQNLRRWGILVLGLGIFSSGPGFAQEGKQVKVEVEQGKWIEVDPYAPAAKTVQGWVEYDQPIPEGEPDPKYPWNPKGPFPYRPSWPRKNLPYTGQELMVFANNAGVKHSNRATYAPKMNARGLIENTHLLDMRLQHYDDYNDVLTYSSKNPLHSRIYTTVSMLLTPPELRALSTLNRVFNNAPNVPWKYPETFIYVPNLRKVRRLTGGGKQDDYLGYPSSYDDQGSREVWEEKHEIIGEDVLCEVSYEKQPLSPLKNIIEQPRWPQTWGAGVNPYRADGCLELWVVKSTHKDLNYYLSYRLIWIEKRTKLELREEQYDRERKLFRTYEICYSLIAPHPPHITQPGWGWTNVSAWDLKRNFYAHPWFANYITNRPIKIEDLSLSRLEQEHVWRDMLKTRQITKAEDFPPYPRLYPEKISKHRNVQGISPNTIAKMKEHNAIWEKRGNIDLWKWIGYAGPIGDGTPYKGGEGSTK